MFFIKVGWETEQIKKLVAVGESKGIIIPRPWLNFYERKFGRELKEVYVTITEMRITISPIAPTGQEKATN